MQTKNITTCDKSSPDAILSRILDIYGIKKKWGWKSLLAEKLGAKQPTVSGWESRGVPEAIIAKVSREENIPLIWIEAGEGEMKAQTPPHYMPEVAEEFTTYFKNVDLEGRTPSPRATQVLKAMMVLEDGNHEELAQDLYESAVEALLISVRLNKQG